MASYKKLRIKIETNKIENNKLGNNYTYYITSYDPLT